MAFNYEISDEQQLVPSDRASGSTYQHIWVKVIDAHFLCSQRHDVRPRLSANVSILLSYMLDISAIVGGLARGGRLPQGRIRDKGA
jgi:hypothetical protein